METSQRLSGGLPPIRRTISLSKLPYWALVLAAFGLFLTYLIFSTANYRETFYFLRVGVTTTIRMTLIAFPIATLIGLIVGLSRISKNVFLFNLATLYVETVRGIPLIVLILYTAFVIVPLGRDLAVNIGQWGLERVGDGFLSGFFLSLANFSIQSIRMESRAIAALAIGYGAFEAEIFRAGIQSIGKGQMEAARSLGMSYLQSMRYVVLPQAIRRVLPPLGNDFIALLKDSSLATVLAVPELTQMGRLRRSSTFRYLETFNVVAYLYLAMTLMLSGLVRMIERRFKYEE
jgi:polar amino acid transport system permease protein